MRKYSENIVAVAVTENMKESSNSLEKLTRNYFWQYCQYLAYLFNEKVISLNNQCVNVMSKMAYQWLMAANRSWRWRESNDT